MHHSFPQLRSKSISVEMWQAKSLSKEIKAIAVRWLYYTALGKWLYCPCYHSNRLAYPGFLSLANQSTELILFQPFDRLNLAGVLVKQDRGAKQLERMGQAMPGAGGHTDRQRHTHGHTHACTHRYVCTHKADRIRTHTQIDRHGQTNTHTLSTHGHGYTDNTLIGMHR